MLSRYQMVRGKRAADDPLPIGSRQDTRKHTRHCLRPSKEMVDLYLEAPTAEAWQRFRRDYLALVEERFREDREPFDTLAETASRLNAHLGCSCPTAKNPDVRRCHTWLALEFMKEKYPELEVVFPPAPPA